MVSEGKTRSSSASAEDRTHAALGLRSLLTAVSSAAAAEQTCWPWDRAGSGGSPDVRTKLPYRPAMFDPVHLAAHVNQPEFCSTQTRPPKKYFLPILQKVYF